MKIIVSAWLSLTLMWFVPGQVLGDPIAGSFNGELNGQHYQVSIDQFSASTYDGIMLIDGDKMQFDARRSGDLISGRLSNATVQLGFRATLEGSALIMQIEDGRRVVLWRDTAE